MVQSDPYQDFSACADTPPFSIHDAKKPVLCQRILYPIEDSVAVPYRIGDTPGRWPHYVL
jgi:hypothetical protein